MATHKEISRASVVIKRPHITEKASASEGIGVYTFIVDKGANKIEIKNAVDEIYKKRPAKVRIVNIPDKKVMVRNKAGIKSGYKKAIVYMRKGDKIDLI